MKTSIKQHNKYVDIRVDELERELAEQECFRKISDEQYGALKSLKDALGDANWLILDDFVSAKNAECDFLMNYFYISGLRDGKNLSN